VDLVFDGEENKILFTKSQFDGMPLGKITHNDQKQQFRRKHFFMIPICLNWKVDVIP